MAKKKPVSKKIDDEYATTRDHVTPDEVDRLRKAASKMGRHGHRDSTMILMAYRHGFRVSELVRLKWDQIMFDEEDIKVIRRKGSQSGLHPMEEDEIKALLKLGGDRKGWVFRTEREGNPRMTENGFFKMLRRAGKAAGFDFDVHPHMLRHGCGYLMNRENRTTRTIQDWLGHKNIQHTVRYTALSADHFRRQGIGRKRNASS